MEKSKKTFHLFFEQSGTFKNEFKKLGFEAVDYDINNEYGQTDVVVDIFNHMESIIEDCVKEGDTIIAFFPCTYFSDQQIFWYRGVNYAQRNWNDLEKIIHSKIGISMLSDFYSYLCRLVEICIDKNIPLIIENPYSPNSFLVRYFPLKPAIIDRDRTRLGDVYKKPTMWYFINTTPNDNLILINPNPAVIKKVKHVQYGKERSEISSCYAENFIKSFIL